MSALAFLTAAHDAMPRSLGDRFRIGKMNGLMLTAIECRMDFKRADAAALCALAESSCVGVFAPVSEPWYSRAAVVGGTYCAMWEAWNGVKPWRAIWGVASKPYGHDDPCKRRMAAGLGVLLPGPEDELPRFNGLQVWWVTSIDWRGDAIVLCRYRWPREGVNHPFVRDGRPAIHRKKLDRSAWNALQKPVGELLKGTAQ